MRRLFVALFWPHFGVELLYALGVPAERFCRHRAVDEHGENRNASFVFEPLDPVQHFLDAANGKRGDDDLAAAIRGRSDRLRQPFAAVVLFMMYSVKDPFRLDQGDVSFDAPDTVKNAMRRAIEENRSHYVQTTGVPRLLELIAEKLRKTNKIPIGSPDEILVTTGGIHALYILCHGLLEPGDEVIVPDPEWPPSMGNIKLARGMRRASSPSSCARPRG